MNYMLASEAEKHIGKINDQVKDLWAYCFEPADNPFFQYYFSKHYEPEHTLVGEENGKVLTTVHLRQYTLRVRGAELPVSYMVGVATHPIARRGGLGGQLLSAALTELRRRHQGLTILMPSKAAFYQQYGWDLYAHQWVRTMPLEELRPLSGKELAYGLLADEEEWTLLAPVYEVYTKKLSGYAVRGEKEWRRLLGSFTAEGVQVAYVHDEKGTVEGYMAYKLGEPEIMVSEMVYTTRRAQKSLLNYLYNHRSQGESVRWNEGLQDTSYIFHPNGKQGYATMPFMMSRIVDVADAFAQVPTRSLAESNGQGEMKKVITLGLTDTLAPWNTGTYRLTLGGSRVSAEKISEIPDNAEATITIGGLSLLLMGRLNASDLVYEGRLQASADIVTALDMVFPRENTYINEWW